MKYFTCAIFICTFLLLPVLSSQASNDDLDQYATPEDCNDTNALVYPSAPELCTDSIDNDCDNITNEGCPTVDNDGDAQSPAEGDCDDTDANVFAGNVEACGDGVDNDCNGVIDDGTGCPAARTEPPPQPPARPSIIPQLGVEIPGLVFSEPLEKDGRLKITFIGDYIIGIYKFMLAAGAIIAVVLIMISGVEYMVKAGAGQVQQAKERIRNSLIGIVILLSSYVLLNTVNPNLVLFKPVSLQMAPREDIEMPPEGEDVNVTERTDVGGNLTPIQGANLIVTANNKNIDADLLPLLNSAADSLYQSKQKRVVVTSAFREPEFQLGLYYKNCYSNPEHKCSVITCNPIKSGMRKK